MKEQYRQGDIFLVKTAKKLPKDATKVEPTAKGNVLALGEVTGHAHAVDPKLSNLFNAKDARFMEVKEGARLVHEEHAPISLEQGMYEVRQQREYHPEAPRTVAD